MSEPLRVAVLASGRGSNLQAILEASRREANAKVSDRDVNRANPHGVAVKGEEGYAAAGRRGAVVSGEEGYVAVGRHGNVVAVGTAIAIGTMLARPPPAATTVVISGSTYYYHDNVYYTRVMSGGAVVFVCGRGGGLRGAESRPGGAV